MQAVTFVVEQAGCDSCAALIRDAVAPVASVEAIAVDAEADTATVRARTDAELSEDAVNGILAHASHGSGHAYRVKPGSWRRGG